MILRCTGGAAFAPHSRETSFLDGGLRANSVKASKDCVIAVLSSEALALLNSQNSLVGYQLMKNISTFEPAFAFSRPLVHHQRQL